jgi:DNA-directed RNA polymerase subunit beta'
VQHEKGYLVAVSRSGELGVVDSFGRERERYKIPYGATITAKEHDQVAGGQIVATWDPHTHPVVTEVAGLIKFQDFVDGLTVATRWTRSRAFPPPWCSTRSSAAARN